MLYYNLYLCINNKKYVLYFIVVIIKTRIHLIFFILFLLFIYLFFYFILFFFILFYFILFYFILFYFIIITILNIIILETKHYNNNNDNN